MSATLPFDTAFEALTGNPPFPWQCALYERMVSDGNDNIPSACNLPTGLGKTSVIPIWLLALATAPNKIPRRLVYVVNRRTVVDQSTREAEKLSAHLTGKFGPRPHILWQLATTLSALSSDPNGQPLAISTLRGQFADNRGWSADPARPAVIVGTVDMIGSRLLFSGYGVGFKMKPLHAGFLGQDALLVHDEAHLEPAFQDLLIGIRREQARCKEFGQFHVMELSATSRGGGQVFPNAAERAANEEHPIVVKRTKAAKAVHLHENKDEKKLADEIAVLALAHENSGRAVLVFARTVDDVEKIADKLRKAKQNNVETLTGTMRGRERDGLVKRPIFQRFLPASDHDANVPPSEGTVYLVCTSAGEVGVNISADHLICDLSTFESMAQRFGRVNRFGERNDTRVDVIYPKTFDEKDVYESRLRRTLELLQQLNGDGSPAALGNLDADGRLAAFAPAPTVLPATDILFDAWALTTIRERLPGRPMVEPYLHGISDYDPLQTTVAWREEVEQFTAAVLADNDIDREEALELYPLKPHEELSGPTYGKNKVFEQLEKIAARDAKREPDKRLSAWVVELDGSVVPYPLEKLVEKDKQNKPMVRLGGRTVILPPHAGGFSGGFLKGDVPFVEGTDYDVSESWFADPPQTRPRRRRVWSLGSKLTDKPAKMRLIRRFDFPVEGDEDAEGRSWHWFTLPNSADDDGSKSAEAPITWDHHTKDVEAGARKLADVLLKHRPDLHKALILAARFHDLGKRRIVWQRSIGNPIPSDWHAKSGKDPRSGLMWKPLELTPYRHEFGSLLDVQSESDFLALKDEPDVQSLILHLIAVHHGYGRPHFPDDRAFDLEPNGRDATKLAEAVPRRFAKLQRVYGRWGLAYLESLLRAADHAASANPSKIVEGEL